VRTVLGRCRGLLAAGVAGSAGYGAVAMIVDGSARMVIVVDAL
jgi:hypothetical protein